ncbi:MAG: PAS domain-containing sensor histidine kinase [Mucilaginibacter sp.]|nr:PAS domain-containing sensor histidine kinase [Mucilaginibacter sp.]
MDRVVEKIACNFQTGEAWEDTFPLRRADGEYRWFLSRMVPAKDQDGNVISWFGTNTDITEQRKMDEQKDDFISIASHELKTPLTSLKANLQILERMKDNLSNPMAPQLIDSSNKSMQKISTLVDDLLNINRFSEGKLQLQKTRFNVWKMLNACSSHVRVDGKHELIVEVDKQLHIYADEHRIDQVVVNFVNNAVKYAPHGRKIWLIVDDLGDNVKISVKDTGAGIPAEQLPHLFDRYWQADQFAPKYNGLGLGLFICAEIIKRHGGHIGADSVLGEGSTFWFTLPKSN